MCSLTALALLAFLGTALGALADSSALVDRSEAARTDRVMDSSIASTPAHTSVLGTDSAGMTPTHDGTPAASMPDSISAPRPLVGLADSTSMVQPRRYSPIIAAGASALVPGLGQVYTRRFVKGGLFLATEAIMGLVAYNRYVDVVYQRRGEADAALDAVPLRSIRDSMAQFVPANTIRLIWNQQHPGGADSLFAADSARIMGSFELSDSTYLYARLNHDRALYERHYSEKLFYHSVGWMGGCYVFNILDALQSSGWFRDEKPRKPALAGWLSAIPGLGLGQWYNGSLSKAGMIFMTQGSMALMAYNYHQLMQECGSRLRELEDANSPTHQFESSFAGGWSSRQKNAERMRNTYLWYSLLFYFYGVFDAVVDAHLHDAPSRMRLEPDLGGKRVGARVNFSF